QKRGCITGLVSGTVLLLGFCYLLSWRDLWNLHVMDVADRWYEVLEVITFCEASKLRGVVQVNVNESPYARSLELGEERFRRFFGKADRKQFHLEAPSSGFRSSGLAAVGA